MAKYLTTIVILLAAIAMSDAQYHLFLLSQGETDVNTIIQKTEEYYRTHDKGKGSGYNVFRRWTHAMRDQMSDGKVTNYSLRLYRESILLHRRQGTLDKRQPSGEWEDVSPDEITLGATGWSYGYGRLNTLAFHPSDNNVFYVGTAAGGIWKTTNDGQTWSCLTNGMPTLGVSGIAIHPTSPNVIYMLTGDGDAWHSPSIGVLKSTNSGATWEPTGLTFSALSSSPEVGFKLSMHPNDPETLYAAMTNGLWKTTDGGATWTKKLNAWINDFEFRTVNPNNMFATNNAGLYISDDHGETWEFADSLGLPEFPEYHRAEIAVTPADPNYIYILFGGGTTGFEGLYRSTNSGQSFTLQSQAANPPTIWDPNIMSGTTTGTDTDHQAAYDIAMLIDPVDPDIVYVGGINLWKSVDGGVEWAIQTHWNTNSGTPYLHGDQHALALDSDGDLYSCNDGGLSRYSTFTGWVNLSEGLNIMQVYDMDVWKTATGTTQFIAGTQDNGTVWWEEGGIGWQVLGADGFECHFHRSNADITYASEQAKRRVTWNGGVNWANVTPTAQNGDHWTAPWIIHPTDQDTSYCSFQHIYRSFLAGLGWQTLDPGFDSTTWNIRAMAQGVNNPEVMYVSNGLQIMRSDNINTTNPADVTWTDVSGIPTVPGIVQINSITVDPTNAGRLWVGLSGFLSSLKVYRSDNFGQTWTNATKSGLPDIHMRIVLQDTASSVNGVYVGSDIGIFYTNDTLPEWIYFSNYLPVTRVYDLAIYDGHIYAGTHGRGVWRTELFDSCPSTLTLTPANDPGNQYSPGIQQFHAESTITSTRFYQPSIGTDIFYQAGGFVRMDPGFEIKAGVPFRAKIGGCLE